jgi:outer membrane protein assembly factor BamD (BamD/ComL family)
MLNVKYQTMKKISFLKIILILFLTVSCNNKETKIKEAENLVDDTKENFDKYRQQDWDRADTVFAALETDLNKNREKYTQIQIENANTVIGRYKAIKIKKELNSFKKSVEDVGQQIKGAMEVLQDSTSSK